MLLKVVNFPGFSLSFLWSCNNARINFDIFQFFSVVRVIVHFCLLIDKNLEFFNLKRSVLFLLTRFFYKHHFYKQHQAGICKKNKHMLSNTLRPNFHYLEIIHIFHSRYHPRIMAPAMAHKVFGAGFSFHVGWRTAGRV